jgi:YHS domain-containing protein
MNFGADWPFSLAWLYNGRTDGRKKSMRRGALAIILILILATTSMTALAQTRKNPEKAKDPVCGLMVDRDPNLSVNYKGETYYFCSKADMEKFKKDPEKYVRKK